MNLHAITRGIPMSPRKVSLVADVVRNMSVSKAIEVLSLEQKRAARVITKTIKSAVSNAVNNAKKTPETLFIESITVAPGTAAKRFHPSTRGRIHPYKKRTSHLTVILAEKGATK